MKTFQIPLLILTIAAFLALYFGYDFWQQRNLAEDALAAVNSEIAGKDAQIERLNQVRRNLLDVNANYYAFRDRWVPLYLADDDRNGGGAAVIAQLDSVARELGLATANRSSEDASPIKMPQSGNLLRAKSIAIQATGDFAKLLNYIGWIETNFPLSRWNRIRLSSVGDRVMGDFQIFVPIEVEAPKANRRR